MSLSQSGCEVHEDCSVMIDTGASVTICPEWFGEPILQESDGSVQLRGKNRLRQYDFHVAEVTKPILRESCLCENATEAHLAREPFLKFGDRRGPLIKTKRCVLCQGADRSQSQAHNRVTRTSHSCVRAEDSQKSCVRAGDSQNLQKSFVRAEDSQISQKSWVRAEDAHKVMRTS